MLYDLAIIGGGINGAGIARDAAGRGASVVLLEKGDLAGATSSASTKLIHGGLRYLEHYKFGLVREALAEREVLWRMAPHLVSPLRFVMPHRRGMRPKWMLRTGLFLYDNLAPRRALPATSQIDLRTAVEGQALLPEMTSALVYSDCAVDDSRLTILNAVDAASHGASIRTRTEVLAFERGADHWEITTRDAAGGFGSVTARVLVNAAGPWSGTIAGMALGLNRAPVRLVKGSHLIVRRRFGHNNAYVFQNGDGRIIFAVPYGDSLTLIGTTDADYSGDPKAPAIAAEETAYLLAAVNSYLKQPITEADIAHAYSGVRALFDDGASAAKDATREYVLSLDTKAAPVLSIYGGKITTYRKLAEAALERLAPHNATLGRPHWTANAPLPGGNFPINGREALAESLARQISGLPRGVIARLVAAYGTLAARVLAGASTAADLGRHFGHGLYEAELDYLARNEWAMTADDVLWRRSKLGLAMNEAEIAAIGDYMATRVSELRSRAA